MSTLDEWAETAESMVRCLTACTSQTGDSAFGVALWVASGEAASISSGAEGRWFTVEKGYVFIGPEGQGSRYQPKPAPGIDPSTLQRLPADVHGQLWHRLEATLEQARRLAADRPAEGDGSAALASREQGLPRVQAVTRLLETALLTRQRTMNDVLLHRSTQALLASMADGKTAAVEAACAEVLAMREEGAIEASVWAVMMVRREAVTRIGDALPSALAFRLFETLGVRGDPEDALRSTVVDLATTGHGAAVMEICDMALETAETARDAALDAASPRAHRNALYTAAGYAFLAMRLAEIMQGSIVPRNWPQDLTDGLLQGYVAQAEELVVRASQAVAVSCVNEESRSAFKRHRALVAASGPSKADELIEFLWFYPRGARSALLGTTRGERERPPRPPAYRAQISTVPGAPHIAQG